MEWTTHKTKLSQIINIEREIIRVAETEHKGIVTVPEIVVVTIVVVEPQIVIVLFDIEQSAVAVRVRMYRIPSTTPLLEYSQSCILYGIGMP